MVFDFQANLAAADGNLIKAWNNHRHAKNCRLASLIFGIVVIFIFIVGSLLGAWGLDALSLSHWTSLLL